MPVITDIKQQQKRQDRYSIYIDGKYAFAMEALDFSASGLKVGNELSPVEVESYAQASVSGKASNQAYRYLSYRPRSELELRRYLKGKGHDEQVCIETIQKFKDYKLIDDESFARAWVEERRRLKFASALVLKQELRAKGISDDIISGVIEGGDEDERQALTRLAQKKLALNVNQDQSKLISYLLSKGFRYSLVKEVLDDLGAAGNQ